MKKLTFTMMLAFGAIFSYADSVTESASAVNNVLAESAVPQKAVESTPAVTPNNNAAFINTGAFIQNPYAGMPSGGGTKKVTSQNLESANIMEKWFNNGTYNIYGGAATDYFRSAIETPALLSSLGTFNTYGVAAFAQTGYVEGFSFGIGASSMNPFFAAKLNPKTLNSSPLAPTYENSAITQAFVEYQYSNLLNVDVGFINIANNPWLTSAFYNEVLSVPVTYQGVMVNVYAGSGWLLNGFAFNGIQTPAAMGFVGNTLYNPGYNNLYYFSTTASSQYTAGLSANYTAWDNKYNLRMNAYQFENFGTLLYSDTSLNLPVNKKVSFNLGAQGGMNSNFGATTAYTNNPNPAYLPGGGWNPVYQGNIQSYFLGAQAGFTADWLNVTLNANTVWGPSNAVGSGTIISPYTVAYGNDPLYAEGWITNMVDDGLTGNLYKATTKLSFMDNNIVISPSWVHLSSANPFWNGTNEVFVTFNYSMPQVKGLNLFWNFAHAWLPSINPIGGNYEWTTNGVISYIW